ncbi:MAG: hypothetical protein AAF639_33980 [Chloroflexota bacterium]
MSQNQSLDQQKQSEQSEEQRHEEDILTRQPSPLLAGNPSEMLQRNNTHHGGQAAGQRGQVKPTKLRGVNMAHAPARSPVRRKPKATRLPRMPEPPAKSAVKPRSLGLIPQNKQNKTSTS